MPTPIKIGDKVSIKAGDEKGSWGVVRAIEHDEYHVAVADGTDAPRLYERSEITKTRKGKP